MFEKQDIEKNLLWLETVKTNVLKDFKTYLTDKRIPLEERYRMFNKHIHLFPNDDTTSYFFNLDLSYFSNYIERNELISYSWLIDNLKYNLKANDMLELYKKQELNEELFNDLFGNIDRVATIEEWNVLSKNKINEYIEKILADGRSGFRYDW